MLFAEHVATLIFLAKSAADNELMVNLCKKPNALEVYGGISSESVVKNQSLTRFALVSTQKSKWGAEAACVMSKLIAGQRLLLRVTKPT